MDTFFSIISQLRILEDLTCQFIIYIYEFRTVGSSEEIWVYKCARYYCYYDMDSLTKKVFVVSRIFDHVADMSRFLYEVSPNVFFIFKGIQYG